MHTKLSTVQYFKNWGVNFYGKYKQNFLIVFSDHFGHCDSTNNVILRLLCLWDTESSK